MFRDDASQSEKILILLLVGVGGMGFFGSFAILGMDIIMLGNPLSSPMGILNVASLVITGIYVACGIALHRSRSGIALSIVELTFIGQLGVGFVLFIPQALISGGIGTILVYLTAKQNDYDLPGIGTLD